MSAYFADGLCGDSDRPSENANAEKRLRPMVIPPEETPEEKAELERLLAWFIQNRAKIAAELHLDEIWIVNERVVGIKSKLKKGEVKTEARRLFPD